MASSVAIRTGDRLNEYSNFMVRQYPTVVTRGDKWDECTRVVLRDYPQIKDQDKRDIYIEQWKQYLFKQFGKGSPNYIRGFLNLVGQMDLRRKSELYQAQNQKTIDIPEYVKILDPNLHVVIAMTYEHYERLEYLANKDKIDRAKQRERFAISNGGSIKHIRPYKNPLDWVKLYPSAEQKVQI